jgi:hypothetical protein
LEGIGAAERSLPKYAELAAEQVDHVVAAARSATRA